MTVEIKALPMPINFAPATVREEVIQNVATILATMRYSVPFARELGLNPDYLSDPVPAARARATADVTRAIRRYEPRCRIESVDFDEDPVEGILIPKVRVSIDG